MVPYFFPQQTVGKDVCFLLILSRFPHHDETIHELIFLAIS